MLAHQKAFCPATGRLAKKGIVTRVAPARLSVFARESRIGSKPIPVPKGVTITIDGNRVAVKVDGKLTVTKTEDTRLGMSQHGLARSLANNMVTGVSSGFTKILELVGTGYRASIAGKELTLNLGYSRPRVLVVPEGIKVTVEKNTTVTVSGYDKVMIGDFCATMRRQRPPEPYKGKGIRYKGEVIKLKEGKAGGKKK